MKKKILYTFMALTSATTFHTKSMEFAKKLWEYEEKYTNKPNIALNYITHYLFNPDIRTDLYSGGPRETKPYRDLSTEDQILWTDYKPDTFQEHMEALDKRIVYSSLKVKLLFVLMALAASYGTYKAIIEPIYRYLRPNEPVPAIREEVVQDIVADLEPAIEAREAQNATEIAPADEPIVHEDLKEAVRAVQRPSSPRQRRKSSARGRLSGRRSR